LDKKIVGGIAVGIIIAIIVAVSAIPQEPDIVDLSSVLQNEKIGLVINTPTSEVTLQQLDQTFSQAASTGIGRSNVYMFWNAIEPEKGQYNWQQSDHLMSFNNQNDLKFTLYFSIING
jgi:GH35 family endo-1,4-beta-xylanase